MRINVQASKIYEWIGRITFWSLLVLFVLYHAYQLGYSDGKEVGYIRGYVEGKLGLRPVDPNLPQGEREQRQFHEEKPEGKLKVPSGAVNIRTELTIRPL
jgi:hypothetical protein